jgi:hypothetical protein
LTVQNWPAHTDAVTIRILEHKRSKPVVLVLDGLDDAQAIALTDDRRRIGIVHHHVSDIEASGLGVGLQREMQLGFVSLQDHEADRITVLERLREAKRVRMRVVGLYNIFHWEHGAIRLKRMPRSAVWFIALPRVRRASATIRTVP